jgi:DNA polymerase-3 subunit delta
VSPAGQGREGACLLLLGPEIGEKNARVRAIRDALAKAHGELPEIERHYYPETRPAALVASMRTGSLFASSRLVIYQDMKDINSKADAAILAEYVSAPAEGVTLLLLSDETRVDRAIQDAVGASNVTVFWELFENRKEDWVRAFFKRSGLGITEEAVQAVLELVENNTEALKAECSRLALMLKPGQELTETVVEEYLSHGRSEDVFSLFGRMAGSGLQEALETLEKILESKESAPVTLVAGLQWSFARLESILSMQAAGLSAEEAFGKLRINSKLQQRLYRQAAGRYPLEACRRILTRLCDQDAELRSTPQGSERLIMQTLVYEIMEKGGQSIQVRED